MMTYDTDYVPMGITVTERDRKALKAAKEAENIRADEGYRWITLNRNHKIFVECDGKGKPTKKGKERIEAYKQYLGIKD